MSAYDEEVGTSGLYLKLKDGDRVKMRLLAEPRRVVKIFERAGEPAGDVKQVWVWPVVKRTKEGDSLAIFEGGPMIFSQIKELVKNEDWGDPTNYDIWVKRKGTGMSTEYHVAPGLRADLPQETLEDVKSSDIMTKLPEHGITIDTRKNKQLSGTQQAKGDEYDPFADD